MFVYIDEKDGLINIEHVDRIFYNSFTNCIQFMAKGFSYQKKASKEEFTELIEKMDKCIGVI